MKNIFSYDGTVMGFISALGELLLLGIISLIMCIPVITAGPALTSLYYAVVKSVRHSRGSILKEYFSSFKRIFLKGAAATFFSILWFAALEYGRRFALLNPGKSVPAYMYVILMILGGAVLIYLFPVMSRFEMSLPDMIKLSLVMSLRYFYFTILLMAGTLLLARLLIYRIPLLWVVALPGILTYAVSFLMEIPLLKYMPPVPEGVDDWYHEKSFR